MYSDKSIDIKIGKHNIDYYLEKGYDVKIKEIHKIKSCDVIKTVSNRIYVICQNCFIERDVQSYNYHNQLKKQNFYVCSNCSHTKIKKTNLIKYGTECPLQNIKIIEKTKKTMLKEYGVDNISKLDSIKDDRRENFKTENFKNKSKITWLDKYGVDNPSKSDGIKLKKEETTFMNYGVKNPSQSSLIFEKSQISGKKIKLHDCGLMYRGTYEKDFLDFCMSENIYVEKGLTIKYNYEGTDRYYHSDFFIPNLNLICEIKSLYYYELYLDKNISKMKSAIDNGYNFEFIIDKNYDKIKSLLNRDF
jgi:hypothetical protein